MKTAIIYHQVKDGIDCPDGIAAAWVARRKYPDAELIGACYGGNTPRIVSYEYDPNMYPIDVVHYDRVLVVDFSFPIATLNEWKAAGVQVTVIDHHKTAMNDLSQFESAIFDMDESGATLTWSTLFPLEPTPLWLEYVKDRDLWNFNLPYSEEIHEAVAFMGRSFRQIDFYCSLEIGALHGSLVPIGQHLLKPKRDRIAALAQTAFSSVVLGKNVLAVQLESGDVRLASDLCSVLYKQNPEKDFVLTYSWNEGAKKFDVSLRSDKNGNDFDVSAIAKTFGGGGHKNAAGCQVEKLSDLFDDH